MMSEAFSTPRNRSRSFILLGFCALLAIAAFVIGIDDNPPGILLAFLASIAFVLAFVHPWRSARQFGILLGAAVIGIPLCIVLNNLFAAVGHNPAAPRALQLLMQGLAVVVFLLAAMFGPVALVVGAGGAVVMLIRNRRRKA